MALDGALLHCIKEEMESLLCDARVDKIHQPSREELILTLRQRSGTFKLYISAQAASPRIHFTGIPLENPPSPPMFCMLLRKRITGGRLAGIRQEGLERALYLDLDCLDELGDVVRLTLAVEVMGRHSNILLVDGDGRIIDAIKRVDLEMSSVRPVLPGLRYTPPPAETNRLDPSLCRPEDFLAALDRGKDAPLDRALLDCTHGLSPLVCREVTHLALRGRESRVSELTPEERERLVFFLTRIRETILTGERRVPYMLSKLDGTPLDYSFFPITQYGLSATGREMESFSALLDAFYAKKDAAQRLKQRSHDMLRVLTNAYERTSRKLQNQRLELERAGRREEKRIWGDLINASLTQIPKGAPAADLVNYFDPDCATVRVPLDPTLSPAQNAQKYYKDYRKARTAETVLAEQIAAGEEELRYLDTVFDALSRAGSMREVEELREELADGGYLRLQRGRQKPPPPTQPLAFRSDDGFVILVGRNNVQNDRLTTKMARGGDIWMHVKNIPGSHVLVITGGKEPPSSTLEQAAVLAALHSRAAASSKVPVDYTEAKHVKKPAGAKPGMVVYETNRTLYVTPDPALAARLRQEF